MADKKFISRTALFKPKGLALTAEGRIYSNGFRSGGKEGEKGFYASTSLMISNREKNFEYMQKELGCDKEVYCSKKGDNVTHFLESVAFGRTAENMLKALSAGDYVMLIGDVQNNNGKPQLVVNDFKLLKKGEAKSTKVETIKEGMNELDHSSKTMEDVINDDLDLLDEDDLPF